MKRADEELCKSQFDLFLKAVADPAGGTWEEVARENEPPDYYLLIDDVRFAVEVRSVSSARRASASSKFFCWRAAVRAAMRASI